MGLLQEPFVILKRLFKGRALLLSFAELILSLLGFALCFTLLCCSHYFAWNFMISLLRRWYLRHFSQPGTIEFALVLICAFIIVYYFMWLVGPIVVALCIAYCLDWPVEMLERTGRVSRKCASVFVMIAFCSFVIFTTVLIVPNVIKQGADFYNYIVSWGIETAANAKSEQQVQPHVSATALTANTAAAALPVSVNTARGATSTRNTTSESDATIVYITPQSASTSATATGIAPTGGNSLATRAADSSAMTIDASANAGATLSGSIENKGQVVGTASAAAIAAGGAAPQGLTIEQVASAVDRNLPAIMAQSQAAAANGGVTELNKGGYKVTIVNNSGSGSSIGSSGESTSEDGAMLSLNPSGGDGTFTLSVTDFDVRIAGELYDIVVSLPEPVPSMVTMPLLENSVSKFRVAAISKIADLMRTHLMPSVVNVFTWLVYIIIVPIFTFLMLFNKKDLQHRVATFVLPNNQRLMREFWPSLHQQIAGYIRGKVIHIIVISIANTLAFMILGVNYAMLLGVGVGLSVVIPYVGAVIIAVPVVFVAVFQFGFSYDLLWVLVIYTIIQLIDSNVLTPMLFSKAMNLDAFSILAAILIFGNLWGFWGVFFAIPLATLIKTLLVRWPNADNVRRRKKEHAKDASFAALPVTVGHNNSSVRAADAESDNSDSDQDKGKDEPPRI